MSGNEGTQPTTQPTSNTINAIASEDAGYEMNEGVKQIAHHPERFITHPVLPGIAPIPMIPEWREPTTQNNLYIKNISDAVSEETLKSIFAAHGEIISVKIMTNEKGESKGFGFVCFSKSADAFKAKLALHGYMLEKKPLYVSFAQKKEERQKQLQQFHTVGYPIHPPPPYAAYTPIGVNYPPDFYPPRQPPLIPYQPQPQGPPITYLGNLNDLPPPHFPPQLAQSSAAPGSKSSNPSNPANSSKGPGPRRGQYSSPSSRGSSSPPHINNGNPASNNTTSSHPYSHGNGHHSYKGSGNSRNYKGNPNNRRDYPPPPDHGGYPPLLIPSPYPPADPNLLSHPPPHLHHPPTPDTQ